MGGFGIRSALGAVVGLCSRWEAGNLIQRAGGAMGLENCTVDSWGIYPDPVSPEALFDFFTGNLPGWRHPLARDCEHAYRSLLFLDPCGPSIPKLCEYLVLSQAGG
jgi:hypothetical protein